MAKRSYIGGKFRKKRKSKRIKKSRRSSARREVYFIPRLDKREYATLRWLADHGYDGSILDVLGVEEEHRDGGATIGGATESEAWQIRDYVESDPDAWLASNGSRSLAEKLNDFLYSIV